MKILITDLIKSSMLKAYYLVVYTTIFYLLFPSYGIKLAFCINLFLTLILCRLRLKDTYIDKTKEMVNKVLPLFVIIFILLAKFITNLF